VQRDRFADGSEPEGVEAALNLVLRSVRGCPSQAIMTAHTMVG
jgi:hypothetical protein